MQVIVLSKQYRVGTILLVGEKIREKNMEKNGQSGQNWTKCTKVYKNRGACYVSKTNEIAFLPILSSFFWTKLDKTGRNAIASSFFPVSRKKAISSRRKPTLHTNIAQLLCLIACCKICELMTHPSLSHECIIDCAFLCLTATYLKQRKMENIEKRVFTKSSIFYINHEK